MIAFKKPKKNFRKKVSTDESEEQHEEKKTSTNALNQEISSAVAPAVKKTKEKSKSSKLSTKSAGLLSFEDELEEGEEFVLKKSRESRKLTQRHKEEKRRKKERIEVSEAAKQEMKTTAPLWSHGENAEAKTNDMNEDEESDENSGEEDVDYKDIHSGLTTGIIPDAATIFAMKKQRERARQLGTGADFVPMESTVKYQGRFSSGSKSRLVREEDEDSDEERIEMKGSQKKSFPALERRKEVAKALEDAHEETEIEKDGDEELDKWEQEQIKKGASIPASQKDQVYGPAQPPVEFEQPMVDPMFQNMIPYSAPGMPFGFPVQSMPAMVPQGMNTVTVDMVSQRIKERLSSIQQVHRAHVVEAEKHKTDVSNYEKNIKSLEVKSADVSERFKFYQEMSGYVQDLIDCLNEKVPTINDLESSMLQLWKQRSHKFHQRRIDDIKDEDNQINGKASTKKGTSGSSDEFGRDRGKYEETAKQRRIAEREGRRNRRKKKRIDNDHHHDGMSSDEEELDAEVTKFNADKERLLQQRVSIFEDVIADFSSLEEIKSRFEEWKFGFNDSYKEAYIHLCLPKLFSPFLRLEMLDWNPLRVENKDFEDMIWFKVLAMYGYLDGDKNMDKEDSNLLPLTIEKILVPRLTDFVKFVWDPLSKTQTSLLVLFVQRLVDEFPTLQKQSKNTEKLFNEIIQRIKNIIDNEIYIPLYPKGLLESRSSGASSFLERQFWSGFKLFGNIMHWKELLSLKVLQELGLDSVVNRYLIVALQQMSNSADSLDKCKELIALIPKHFFDGSDQVPQSMQPLARYINGLAGNIYKSSLGYADQEKRKAKLMIKKCISLLMHMQAFDFARTIAKDYKIETVQEKS